MPINQFSPIRKHIPGRTSCIYLFFCCFSAICRAGDYAVAALVSVNRKKMLYTNIHITFKPLNPEPGTLNECNSQPLVKEVSGFRCQA